MSYTSAEVITIIVSVGGLVTIIGGVIVQIMTARVKQAVKEEVTQLIVPVTETLTTAKVIAGHVNSEKSIDAGEIKTLVMENKMLREQLAKNDQVAALLAAKVPVPIQVINGPLPKSVDPDRTDAVPGSENQP